MLRRAVSGNGADQFAPPNAEASAGFDLEVDAVKLFVVWFWFHWLELMAKEIIASRKSSGVAFASRLLKLGLFLHGSLARIPCRHGMPTW
jgi:hypothetical protein